MHVKENASKASAKPTGVGGGVCERSKQEKNREAVDIFGKKSIYQTPSPVINLSLAAPPLDHLIKLDQSNFSGKLLIEYKYQFANNCPTRTCVHVSSQTTSSTP